ncbi:MAG: glycosyltransferase [Candidatus Binatus sp.]|jgi:glycosyltransferase involved in cell wall biosynthesis|uniref:glycosyltransferase n=1 Tax=Candidatus Binatus sp. TaxID=2811406 RepID=UPI003C73980E
MSVKPLRVVLVMIEPPLPFGNAAARWYYVLLRGLVERGHRVTAFAACSNASDVERAASIFPAPQYDLRCYPVENRNSVAGKLETIRKPHSYLFRGKINHDVAAVLREGYDVLHLEQLWSGWTALEADPAKALVNLHYLYAIDDANSGFVDVRTALLRALRKRAERNLLQRFGTIAAITPRLEDKARRMTGSKVLVYWFPFAIDPTLYRFVPAAERPTRPIVSLIGSMNWRPSQSAAVRLITRLWPGIKRQVPDAKLRIVGWRARSALREYVDLPDVEIIEDVPDIRPYFNGSSVLVHAADQASGIKVKIVEAMAFGIPVVTNTEGIEGLPVRDGVHLLVSDDDSGIIERTAALLRDVPQQERMRLAARDLIETQCSPARALDAVEACYRDLIARRGAEADSITLAS